MREREREKERDATKAEMGDAEIDRKRVTNLETSWPRSHKPS